MKLLHELMNAFGVSGNEDEVRSIIMREIKKYVDGVYIDKLGNLIAYKKGKLPKVMLAAHMDEVGLMISKIRDDGSLGFSIIGHIEPMVLLGQRVHIKTKKGSIHGVITSKRINNARELNELLGLEDLYVDIGLTKEETKKLGVGVGNYLSLEQNFINLGNKNFITGKALDDRVGCYILLELAKKLKNNKNEINYVFTVQEEMGLYGSKISAYSIEPDWGIAVDVTNADDRDTNPTKILDNGPCITIKDASMLANRCIDEWLIDIAKKKKIPIQLEVSDTGTTDALSINLSKGGVPTTVLGVAVRNLHSTIGIVSIKDINNAINLLYHLLKNPPKTCIV